jgi:hypothetical protein
MPTLSKPSTAARTALIYITVGTLMVVWTGVWRTFLHHYPPENDSTYYWCTGFMITGIALVILGLAVGQIGRSARHAELPPSEVISEHAQVQQPVAAAPPIDGPVTPAAPVVRPQAHVATSSGPVPNVRSGPPVAPAGNPPQKA